MVAVVAVIDYQAPVENRAQAVAVAVMQKAISPCQPVHRLPSRLALAVLRAQHQPIRQHPMQPQAVQAVQHQWEPIFPQPVVQEAVRIMPTTPWLLLAVQVVPAPGVKIISQGVAVVMVIMIQQQALAALVEGLPLRLEAMVMLAVQQAVLKGQVVAA